jgi:hypothetical protein
MNVSVSRYDPIYAKGPFNIDDPDDDTDAMNPMSWAGKEFAFTARNSTINYVMMSPFGTANVQIKQDNTTKCTTTVTTYGETYACNQGTGEITVLSDLPILLFIISTSNSDPSPIKPAENATWIGANRSTFISTTTSVNSTYKYWRSDSGSISGNMTISNTSGDSYSTGSYGNSPAYLFIPNTTDYKMGVFAYADSDGNDGLMMKTIDETSTIHGSAALNTDYISVAGTEYFSCDIYTTSHTSIFNGNASSPNSEIYYLGFGVGNSSTLYSAPWYMECTKPVMAYYQKDDDSESVLWSSPMLAKYDYPSPSIVSIGSETEEIYTTGSWESDDSTDVIDLVWNGGWGDGTDESIGFEAWFSELSITETITFQMRTSDSTSGLSTATYQTLGVATSGTSIQIPRSTILGLGLAEGFDSRYVQVKAILDRDSANPSPILNGFSIYFQHDDEDPDTNATNVQIPSLNDEDWVNTAPVVTWTEATDIGEDMQEGSGILGYCIAIDEVDIGNGPLSNIPETSSGILSSLDDGITQDYCPYIIQGNSLDLSSITGINWQTGKQYYISLQSVDYSGNINNTDTYLNLTDFKYDDTGAVGVPYISSPNGVFGAIEDIFFSWPTSGTVSYDDHSGFLGWQYSINSNSEWTGPDYNEDLDIYYVADQGGTALHQFTEYDTDLFIVGNNNIYFRAIDVLGNGGTYVMGGVSYGGEAPKFDTDGEVIVTPSTNIENSFGISWDEANPGDGHVIQGYYYMINREPPVSLSTLTSNSSIYIYTNSTSVDENKLIGAVKGDNTVCIVAIDESDNYSPSNKLCTNFILNSTNPDAPANLFASDSSIKANLLWRVSLTWQQPEYTGNGDLTYIVERAEDELSPVWEEIGRTTGSAYTDTVPESKEYLYRVATIDSSDESKNDPTYSEYILITPEGSFDTPAELTSEPEIVLLTTKRASIVWYTERESDSKIQFGLESGTYFEEEPSKGDQVIYHKIDLINLNPGTVYYFKAKWTDVDGNTGYSDEISFQTLPAPSISKVLIL